MQVVTRNCKSSFIGLVLLIFWCCYLLQERAGLKLDSEKLLLRGEEEKFLNSLRWHFKYNFILHNLSFHWITYCLKLERVILFCSLMARNNLKLIFQAFLKWLQTLIIFVKCTRRQLAYRSRFLYLPEIQITLWEDCILRL